MLRVNFLIFCCIFYAIVLHLGSANVDYDYGNDYIDVERSNQKFPFNATSDADTIKLPKLGWVRGKLRHKIIANRPIHAFFGLKYGIVGRGIARFQKASYPNANIGTFDATAEAVVDCPSFPDLDRIDENERRGGNVDDCLTLTVYTPRLTSQISAPQLSVMVYVHGEMLFDGSAAEAQPDYLLEKDVVLVSVNYRLAPFGFLSTMSADMPGNVALADIQMALEWVRENIRSFAGNPDEVTLFGQSGGATVVHALALSGKAQGLFQKLILQSGTALNPYFIDEDPMTSARNLARSAMCPAVSSSSSIVSCFARLRSSEILRAFKFYLHDKEPQGLAFCGGFKLTIGDHFGYLPMHPAAMVNRFRYPLIAGVTKDAGAFIMSRFYNQLLQVRSNNLTDFIRVVLLHTSQPRHFSIWTNWAMEHIFAANEIRNPSLTSIAQGLLELTNLILYRAPVIESIRNSSKTIPTFLYSFDYRGKYHRYGHLDSPLPFPIDATLSDENIYLFPYPEEVRNLNEMDALVARQMVSMWTNFAQFNAPQNNSQIWPRVSNEYGPFVRISQRIEFDYHFGEGVPVPNLYPEFRMLNSTATASTLHPNRRRPQM